MKNNLSIQNDNPYAITTRKYLSFFRKISSHHVLSQNSQLAEVNHLCITLAEKVEPSTHDHEHETIHKILKNCMKTIQESFLMVIEKKQISQDALKELYLHSEELKSYIANVDNQKLAPNNIGTPQLHQALGKNGSFKQFLENGRNHHLISISPETFEEPLNKQTLNFKRDVEKILNPEIITDNEEKSWSGLNKPMSITVISMLVLALITIAWMALHYQSTTHSLKEEITKLQSQINQKQ
jgi:hypothetical protein